MLMNPNSELELDPDRLQMSVSGSRVLSTAQWAIWIDQALQPELPQYVIGALLHGQGRIDVDCLRTALQRVADRHHALRIRIGVDDAGVPSQQVLDALDVDLQVVKVPALHTDEAWLAQELARLAVSPIDVKRAPLWEAHLLCLGDERWTLVFRIHHIICDGVGLDLIQREIESAYRQLSSGREFEIRGAPSLFEAIDDEAGYLASPRYARDREFWAAQHPVLEPVLIDPRIYGSSPAAARSGQCVLELPRARFNALTEFASAIGGTLSHLMLAVLAAYFARVHARTCVVIGLAVHNRHGARQKQMVGMFSSVLPLRIDVDPASSLADLVRHIAGQIRQCFRHQRYPMVELSRRLRPRQHGRSEIYDVSFSFEAFGGVYQFGAALASTEALDHEHEALPLAVSVRDYDPAKPVRIVFNHHLARCSAAAAQALLTRFDVALAAIADPESMQVADLPLLIESEHLALMRHGAAAALIPKKTPLTHFRIARCAAVQPDAWAVVGDGVGLRYGELNARANQVAHRLLALGVQPDDRVGLCVRRGPELLIGLLGIHKAGAAYVPLDPDYPPQRLAYMLADAAPTVLVSESAPVEIGPTSPVAVLRLDDAALAVQPDHDPVLPSLTAQHLAYVIYTSGSTGTPKGVMVEHAQLAQQVDTHIAQCGLTRADRMLQFASISFDSAVVEIFPTLVAGATLVLRAATPTPDADFVAHLDRHQVTITDLPTAFWAQWAQRIGAGQSRPGLAQRLVVVGGEKVERRHLQAWLDAPVTRGCRWLNTYGPTEATVYASAFGVAAGVSCPQGEIPIGRPTGQSRIYLLDRSGRLLPPGAIGEICIGGPGVARGYLNRPELTAERFVADSFGAADARLYRTGDLGRWREDGELEFLGRNDHQLKLRGFRIEPGEVEAALEMHESIDSAVVLVRGAGSEARLIAYVVLNDPSATPDIKELRAFLASRLAEPMLPAVYVPLAALPLTVNGKIDRAALPAPESSVLLGSVSAAPQTALEQTLATLWGELLGIEQIGREDNFFEIGGHSLLLISLIERLRRMGIASEVRTHFDAPNLAALAAALDGAATISTSAPSNRIPPDATAITPDMLSMLSLEQGEIDTLCTGVQGGASNIQDAYPLAPLQEGMLFHHRLDAEGDAYLMHTVLAFDGRAQLDAFVQALQQVIDRHDVLRTSVHWQGLPHPVQVVQRRARLPVHELRLEQDESLAQLLAATDPRRLRLDLQQAPLMAAYVIADPARGRWLLALLEHHIVCDHVTLERMIDEVGLILQGRQGELPEPWPYRHFVAQTLAIPASTHEAYFRAQLADVSEATAPFGVIDVHAVANSEEATLALDTALSRRLRERARSEGMSPSVWFHLAWAMVIARCSGRDEAVFGTVLAGRSQGSAGADRAMGLFLNTLPVRIPLRDRTLRDALHETRGRLAELLAHEQAPLALAQRCSGVAASQPLFTCMFNYRHSSIATIDKQRDDGIAIRGCQGMRVLRVDERSNYPLSISIDDRQDRFDITVHAVPAIGAERMVAMLQEVLRGLAGAAATSSVAALPVLPAVERQTLQQLAGKDLVHDDLSLLAGQLFERHVRSTPAAVALVAPTGRLTYAELDARADRLARGLAGRGLGPDDLVALYLPRGVDLVTAILAVWKAGAAYLPLDPDYPVERLAYMLADSGARLLLFAADSDGALQHRFADISTVAAVSLAELEVTATASGPMALATLDHLAYVIYTSGSTGRPKGVMVSHRGLGNLVYALQQNVGLHEGAGVLQFAASSFDASVAEIMMALGSGARLHLPTRAELLPGTPLIRTLSDPEISHAILPSSALAACGDEVLAIPPGKLTLMVGGDVFPPALAQRWAQRQTVFNAYGPTEATVCASIHSCRADAFGMVPIGRPLPNTRLYLLDAQGQPVPRGAIGEIHIGGIGVARGYLHRPELTAERFVADPFQADASLYRTGDLGRWRDDGELEFHGRKDQQVKLRGFRIETGEIEAVLVGNGQVRDAVVVLRGEGAAARLIAYVVADNPTFVPDPRELRALLAGRLPEYMLPAAYVQLPALPLSPSGKVDRTALPEPGDDALLRADFEAPVGEVEIALAEIWSELLRVQRVGRRDDFSELGGHSLLVMQLATRLCERFSIEVPLRELFERSGFVEQANLVVGAQLLAYAGADVAALEDELGGLSEIELRALLME